MSDAAQKSRLGSLLIRKGLLTQAQLDTALQVQLKTQQRLGEVLVEQGLLSERQLQKALKKQDRTRFAAAFIAMVLGPMSFGAFASQSTSSQTDQASASSQISNYQGLKSLDDSALDDIQGQGFQTPHETLGSLMQQASGDADNNALGALDEVAALLNPLSSMLDADITVKGVKYNHSKVNKVIHADGSIELTLPSEIEEIAFRDLRVKGSTSENTFGDIVISGMKFSDQSSIRIRVRN
jgi:hypothetical protein